MSSYGSNKSGFLHPQYQPQPQVPPYPTTPDPTSNGVKSPFYPPTPQPQQHTYSSSPTSHSAIAMPMVPQDRRRSSSTSSYNPAFSQNHPDRRRSSSNSHSARPTMAMPIPMRQPSATTYTPSASYPPQPTYAQQAPMYARSNSHHSQCMWDPHAYADGEDRYEQERYEQFAAIDEATEREYEKRYAREKKERRELENRPTLGGSLLSMGRKVGGLFGSERS